MGSFLLFRMPDMHRASRIAHRASCTLNDASLALQRDAELRRYDVSPRSTPFNKDNDEDTDEIQGRGCDFISVFLGATGGI